MDNFTYKFPAVSGFQNGRAFYQATVPFRALASLLKLDDDFDVNKRSQRMIDASRAKKVSRYLADNYKRGKDGFFVIPPLVGFVVGEFEFEEVPLDGFVNVGRMIMPIDSKIMLFDGQHRAYGVREAMDLCRELGTEQVSIMFFSGMSLSERKQAFHDINFTQKTPATAICIAYNERSEYDSALVDILSKSSVRAQIEYEKNTVSGTNDNFYSLKSFKDFTTLLVGKEFNDESKQFLADYVDELFSNVNLAAWLVGGRNWKTAKELRDGSVVGHAVMLQAFGLLGSSLACCNPNDWKEKLKALSDQALWHKDDDRWIGRCVNEKGRMVSNKLAVRLTSYELKRICGAPLTPEEKVEEKAEL